MPVPLRLLVALALVAVGLPAAAQERVVQIGGGFGGSGRALLNVPPGRPSVGLVLLPGGNGDIGLGEDGSIARQRGNWVVNQRAAYARQGMATLLVDAGSSTGEAVRYLRTITPRVVVVAMSRGATRVADTLGQRPNGVVFASATLNEARAGIGDASRLPATIIIHHRRDTCRATLPSDVEPFVAWTGGKARVTWIDGGTSSGDVCAARAYHGFVGRKGAVVSAIVGFARSVR
jgi:hypothetical protein